MNSSDLASLAVHIEKLREEREAEEPQPAKRPRNAAQVAETPRAHAAESRPVSEAAPGSVVAAGSKPAVSQAAPKPEPVVAAGSKPDAAESKEDRKKRLHARFMRFSRSLTSSRLSCYMLHACSFTE